jgi:hypothetical protein
VGGVVTRYHAQYFAYELTQSRAADDQGKFTPSLQDTTVRLNPHRVEAALFALKSPLTKGFEKLQVLGAARLV